MKLWRFPRGKPHMVISYKVRVGRYHYFISECCQCDWHYIGGGASTDEEAMGHVEATL